MFGIFNPSKAMTIKPVPCFKALQSCGSPMRKGGLLDCKIIRYFPITHPLGPCQAASQEPTTGNGKRWAVSSDVSAPGPPDMRCTWHVTRDHTWGPRGSHPASRDMRPLTASILLAALGPLRVTASKFECPEKSGIFPDPDQCDRYWVCHGGN